MAQPSDPGARWTRFAADPGPGARNPVQLAGTGFERPGPALDLFAGSGVLGFEAASRGADYVALVERSRPAFTVLQKHAEGFACPRLELFCCDALKFAPPPARRFDLIFLDPPYGQGWLARVESRLDDLAAADAKLYVEAEMSLERLGRWSVAKQGRAGQVFFHLLEQA
jgi:16S rRNA (guanine966-N2)-methyltransferase